MTLNSLINDLRVHLDDKSNSKLERREDLSRQVNGTNTTFIVSNFPLVPGSLKVSVDGGSEFVPPSIDETRGGFTLTTAPTTSLFATYNWQFYSDDDLTDFIDLAIKECGFPGVASLALVPESLIPAVHYYAISHAWEGLYGRHSEYFDAQAAGKGISKNAIPERFQRQSEAALAQATQARQEYYMRQGRREAPAYGSLATQQTPYTPRR